MKRKYLPTMADLIDRLSIDTLKSIKLGLGNPEKKANYEQEASEIMHDIDLLMRDNPDKIKDWGAFIRGIQLDMLANETIWANETRAREGGPGHDHLLPFTHSVNGVRMRAGNVISEQLGHRIDLNLDRVNDEISAERGYDWSGILAMSGCTF